MLRDCRVDLLGLGSGTVNLKKKLFLYECFAYCILCTACLLGSQGDQKNIRFPGTRGKHSEESSYGCWELKPSYSAGKVLFTAKPFLHP